ncbi:MAG TPA: diacylglycerol kinase family protein [Blastocatellia bacterium]|nr:diacylglycerol kinase family protein [Blastocatellia bacterium]
MPSRLDVIINARSGTSDKEAARSLLANLFATHGIEAHISLARSGEEIVKLARHSIRGDAQTIVAGGGDGTINAIASLVAGTNKTLGVLPLGTLNHFAKDLRIPLDLAGAAQTIIAGHAVMIDVGEVNERIFVNNSSLGLYPHIVHHRDTVQRLGHGKWPAFVWAAWAVLRRYPFLDVRLISSGKELKTRTPFVFIGNNRYEMESFNVGRRARLDAGELSLYVTHRTDRLGLLRLALRALFKRLRRSEDFMATTLSEVWIETRHRRMRVAMDGEVAVLETPLHYRVRAGALRVVVPEESTTGIA